MLSARPVPTLFLKAAERVLNLSLKQALAVQGDNTYLPIELRQNTKYVDIKSQTRAITSLHLLHWRTE